MGKGSKGGCAKPHVSPPTVGGTPGSSNAPKSVTKFGHAPKGHGGSGKGAK